MSKLSARFVKTAKDKGMYGDGQGLYLQVTPPNGKSWILRTKVYGQTKNIGIGSAHLIPLAEAREEARKLRKIARSGGDPLAKRNRETLTVEQAVLKVYASKLPNWKGGAESKHARGWINTLTTYALPQLGSRPIDTITSADIVSVLTPIWHEKAETARRVKQRLSVVFDWAKAAGHYNRENPVTAVKNETLGVQVDKVEHFAALAYEDAPALFSELSNRDAMSARLLQLSMLCVLRPSEMRKAQWTEFDLEARIWIVPSERMKGRKNSGSDHRVPLSDTAIAVLETVMGAGRKFVFPASKRGKDGSEQPLSDNAVRALLKRLDVEATGHGMRSTFRQWGQEQTNAPRDVLEMCLAHIVGSKVERAYARSDLLEQCREVMNAWSNYLTMDCSNSDEKIIDLAEKKNMTGIKLDLFGDGQDIKSLALDILDELDLTFGDLIEIQAAPDTPAFEEVLRGHLGEVDLSDLSNKKIASNWSDKTLTYNALYAASTYINLNRHIKAGKLEKAVESAASLGVLIKAMQVNGEIELASKGIAASEGHTQRNRETAEKLNARNEGREDWIIKEAQRVIAEAPSVEHTALAEELVDTLHKKIKAENLSWKPLQKTSIFNRIKPLFFND